MDQNTENKTSHNNKVVELYYSNKTKIFIFAAILVIIGISIIFLDFKNEKKNELISEKYIQAGLYLSSDKKTTPKYSLKKLF